MAHVAIVSGPLGNLKNSSNFQLCRFRRGMIRNTCFIVIAHADPTKQKIETKAASLFVALVFTCFLAGAHYFAGHFQHRCAHAS